MSLSGLWKLNRDKTQSQKDFLRAMGRPSWQLDAIDKADEHFRLIHLRSTNDPTLHMLDKKVVIFLSSRVLKLLSFIPWIEFDKVRYTHQLFTDDVKQLHDDDEKRFGDCSSVTTWQVIPNKGIEGFMIKWYLANGILSVFHYVNKNDNLVVRMRFTFHKDKPPVEVTKTYDRHVFSEEDRAHVDAMTEKHPNYHLE